MLAETNDISCEKDQSWVINQVMKGKFTHLQVTSIETVSGPTYISDI